MLVYSQVPKIVMQVEKDGNSWKATVASSVGNTAEVFVELTLTGVIGTAALALVVEGNVPGAFVLFAVGTTKVVIPLGDLVDQVTTSNIENMLYSESFLSIENFVADNYPVLWDIWPTIEENGTVQMVADWVIDIRYKAYLLYRELEKHSNECGFLVGVQTFINQQFSDSLDKCAENTPPPPASSSGTGGVTSSTGGTG